MKVGIVGYGWVGKAMHKLFPEAYLYTRTIGTKDHINECDIAFICVPTPNPHEGMLDTSIVEEAISWCQSPLIVVRSTVNPGDCDRWEEKYGKAILFQPEYLGETPAHPLLDPLTRPFLIIGGYLRKDRRKLIELYQTVYNANVTIREMPNYYAEIVKLSENRAIAFKVAQCQELYDVCEKAGINYYTIRDAVYGDDFRFNLWWSFVYPDKRGFNSKCIPKDVYGWCAWAESLGYNPVITKAITEQNKQWINAEST
jgi:UDPglucose 6-dehydrogenase